MQEHHAYLYEGPSALLEDVAESARLRFGFLNEGAAAVSVRSFETFGIEESRALIEESSLKTVTGRALFVIAIASITTEAQQALLKLFEEPQEGLLFVIIVPHGALLPTLRSRFLEYPEKLERDIVGGQTRQFLASAYEARSTWLTEFLKDDEGVRERVREFLSELEVALYGRIEDARAREGLRDIAHFRSYLFDRSPSIKMLLEHLALSLPQLK